ncbi:MAG: PIN domain-containing protein [Candidatus Neomarinimicrobiota bacterium]
MANKPLLYWDSCIFLAWLQNERDKGADVLAGIEEIVRYIHKNQAILITSAMTRAEVLRSTLTAKQVAVLDGVLQRRNVEVVETLGPVWDLAHDIRDHYKQLSQIGGPRTVSLPDAVHLATAINRGVDVFYTLDEKDRKDKPRALIPLSHNVAGRDLLIEKPHAKQMTLGLGIAIGAENATDEEDLPETD